MIDYLNFPTENIVAKKLTSKKYIKSANLTDAEHKRLAPYLDGIEILYSFPFDDGELIVLLAEFSEEEYGRYTLHNFVMAIAQSIPYKILLIIKCEGVIRFFSFDEKENQTNTGRSKVLSVHSSTDIILVEDNVFDNIMISELRTAAEEVKSAEELHSRWHAILSGNDDYDNGIIDDTFAYSLKKYQLLLSRKKAFQIVTEKDSSKHSSSEQTKELYDGTALDIEEEADQMCFIEFCAAASRELFDSLDDQYKMPEDEWLQVYLDGCNNYAISVFNRVLNSRCAEIISNGFWNEGNVKDDYFYGQFDLEDLKEHVGSFYFAGDYEVV